jgi:hypothetical protein
MDLEALYPERQATESEKAFFKRQPEVAGYAAPDNRVVLNPFLQRTDQQKAAVIQNERIRHFLMQNPQQFTFQFAPHQSKWATGNEYRKSPASFQQSIIARILTGDDSLAPYSPEQLEAAKKVQSVIAAPRQFSGR